MVSMLIRINASVFDFLKLNRQFFKFTEMPSTSSIERAFSPYFLGRSKAIFRVINFKIYFAARNKFLDRSSTISLVTVYLSKLIPIQGAKEYHYRSRQNL